MSGPRDAWRIPGFRACVLGLVLVGVAAALMVASSSAQAANCPPIKNKPNQTPHVSYDGVRHLSFCYGPITVNPGRTSSASTRRTSSRRRRDT